MKKKLDSLKDELSFLDQSVKEERIRKMYKILDSYTYISQTGRLMVVSYPLSLFPHNPDFDRLAEKYENLYWDLTHPPVF